METDFKHVIDRIANAKVSTDPYTYFFAENVFPEAFYLKLVENLPDVSSFKSLSETGSVSKGSYPERFIFFLNREIISDLPFTQCLFWSQFSNELLGPDFRNMLLEKFKPELKERFKDKYDKIKFSTRAELLLDKTHYSIGPHTDLPMRALTILFYFPKNADYSHLGTSIYKPHNPLFTCEGYAHYSFEPFQKVYTAPFIPNSVFGFVKSDRSFHGVEPIEQENIERNLMNVVITCE